MEDAWIILAVTLALAVLVKVLQRKLVDQKKVKGLQAQLKEDNKRYMALLKEADKNKKEIEELQASIMKNNMAVMNSSMKLNFVILPVFLAALWGLGFLFGGKILESFVPLPTFKDFALLNPASWVPAGISTTTGYYKAYFFYYIISTITIAVIEKIYDAVRHPELREEKKRKAQERKAKEEKEKEEKNRAMDEKNAEAKGEQKGNGNAKEEDANVKKEDENVKEAAQ